MSVALNYNRILQVIDGLDAFKEEISEFSKQIESDAEHKSAIECITVNYKEFLEKAMIVTNSLKEYYVGVINNVPIDVYGQEVLTAFQQYPIFPKEEPMPEPKPELTTKADKKSNK